MQNASPAAAEVSRARSASSSPNSVRKALRILMAFNGTAAGLSVGELAASLGYAPSTVHRLLQSLMVEGFVIQQRGTRRYEPGPSAIAFAAAVLSRADVQAHAGEYLHRLVAATGETASLATRDGDEALLLDRVESPAAVRVFASVGKRAPLHCTAVGKIFLAWLPREEVLDILARTGMKRYTRQTITDPQQLLRELEQVRARGYAVDNEEFHEDARCVAAPVRNWRGEVVAALNLAALASRLSFRLVPRVAAIVTEQAARLSRQLGYRPAQDSVLL